MANTHSLDLERSSSQYAIGSDSATYDITSNFTNVVSGFMRTGTSMMMRALEAGGLEATKSNERDKMNDRFGDKDYRPNPNGFYEIENLSQVRQDDFMEKCRGKLIKAMFNDVLNIPVKDYKIVFMIRDKEEIRQSFEAFFNTKAPMIERYDERMEHIIKLLKNRKDVQLTVLNYRDVIDNPRKEFQKLKDGGWKIDVDKCISIVDPNLCRFRKENLTIGI